MQQGGFTPRTQPQMTFGKFIFYLCFVVAPLTAFFYFLLYMAGAVFAAGVQRGWS